MTHDPFDDEGPDDDGGFDLAKDDGWTNADIGAHRHIDDDGRYAGPKDDCSVPGCDEEHHAKGLCNTHYLRSHRGQPLDPAAVHSAATHRTRVTPWRYV